MPFTDPTTDPGTAGPVTADRGSDADFDAPLGHRRGAGSDVDRRSGADAHPGAHPGADAAGQGDAGEGGHGQDRVDLRIPDELIALVADDDADDASDRLGARRRDQGTAQLSVSLTAARDTSPLLTEADLLDRVADWGPAHTSVGVFHLVPVRVDRDLPLISRWMNDPASAFWELSGPQNVTEDHLRAQLADDGRSVPCIGVLDGKPMSYWEIYRADLDPLARHYPARPHDTGLHLLVGAVADRGRGLGGLLVRAVADLALAQRSSCARVIAEPDIRNTPSIAAFLTAGFRFSAEVDLPAKRAALMVRDRPLRHLL
ncbi:GNAT family N-acetyltransferase [Streptomyces sp. NPDC057099]|uniref:GNAT family N-acetyltransferase n=1 Tax=Streptomyces sp. NPDC057099 TaxID=3346019 RepID=UPI00362EEA1E